MLRSLFNDPKQGFQAARFLNNHPANEIHIAVAYEQRDEFPKILHMLEKSSSSERAWAYYSQTDGKIRINHMILHQNEDDEESMIRDKERLGKAIDAIATVLVHEASHARDAFEPGGLLNSLETELIAYYREMFFFMDSIDRLQLTPDLAQTARALREGEPLKARIDAYKELSRKSKRPLTPPAGLKEEADAYNKKLKALSQLMVQETHQLLSFMRGNREFEEGIGKLYGMRFLICTEDGLRRSVKSILADKAELDRLGNELREVCARSQHDCSASLAQAESSAQRSRRRADELSAPQPRGHICRYYAKVLEGLRKEADERRLLFRPAFDKL